jgi:hypothetical protein
MPLGAASYRQVATYWGSPEMDGFGGVSYGPPSLIRCRWEDRIETFMDQEGNEKISKSVVYTYDRLDVDGYLAPGNYTTVLDPTELDEAMLIQRSDEIPDLRLLNYERRSYL